MVVAVVCMSGMRSSIEGRNATGRSRRDFAAAGRRATKMGVFFMMMMIVVAHGWRSR